MRIILGTESFTPNISGVAVATELLAANLAKQGHSVHVFAPSRSYRTHRDADSNGFSVIRFRAFPNLMRRGFRITLLPQIEVGRFVREVGPDIIHLQDPGSLCTAVRKAGRKLGVPIIVSNHFKLDYALSYVRCFRRWHPQMGRMLRWYMVRFYNQCNAVFCPTETVRRELESWGIRVPIVPISNGVDLERFYSYSSPAAIRTKYHLPPVPLVLHVGRLDKDKSVEVLVKAIPHVLREAEAHFVFVGDGGQTRKLKAAASALGLAGAVTFLGWIEHASPDLPQLYQMGSLFAIPSAIETQSMVTLEAMAAGLPVVGANGGALPELVKDGENGFLFPPGDAQALARGIVAILGDEEARARMCKKSLEIVSQHQIAESLAKIEEWYERARSVAGN